MSVNVMILKIKREKTLFFFLQNTIQNMCCKKINIYPMFAVYMYKNIDMLKSKHYTR
jgi:hypothetical protein